MHTEDACPFDVDPRAADYSIFGDDFAVRIPYEQQREGYLLWVNEDWFSEHGVSFERLDARHLLNAWLLDTFSIRIGADIGAEGVGCVHADRYGGPNGTAHGGSGRCVYRGRFNVKGVGPTPLVPVQAKDHVDGLFSLIEGIRAAIYAELVQLETIMGAIRTIAIIQVPPRSGSADGSCCLLVRPNFIRPSHAERSLYFGTSGFLGSDQFIDHCRVEAVRKVLKGMSMEWSVMADNAATQIGSLDALRMAQGLFTTSNMSVFGEVADFDTFRAFDSWDYLRAAKRGEDRFGLELRDVVYAARSWAWRLSKERHSIDVFLSRAEAAYEEGFIATLKWVVPSWNGRKANAQDGLCRLILSVSKGGSTVANDWIADESLDASLYIEKARALSKFFGLSEVESLVVAGRLAYWRKSLASINHDAIASTFKEFFDERSSDRAFLSSRIAECVHRSRRLHHGLGDWLIPLFVSAVDGTLVLFHAQDRSFLTVAKFAKHPPSPQYRTSDQVMSLAYDEDIRRGDDRQTSIVAAMQRIMKI